MVLEHFIKQKLIRTFFVLFFCTNVNDKIILLKRLSKNRPLNIKISSKIYLYFYFLNFIINRFLKI